MISGAAWLLPVWCSAGVLILRAKGCFTFEAPLEQQIGWWGDLPTGDLAYTSGGGGGLPCSTTGVQCHVFFVVDGDCILSWEPPQWSLRNGREFVGALVRYVADVADVDEKQVQSVPNYGLSRRLRASAKVRLFVGYSTTFLDFTSHNNFFL